MKILVIRFSSIGDLTQSLSIPAVIKNKYPDAKVHFITRADFAVLLQNNPSIHKIWALDKNKGFKALINLGLALRKEKFDIVYDAHNNLRSFVLKLMICCKKTLTRPMYRWKRFLLIRLKINLFEKPFSGQRDLLKPLEKLNIPFQLPPPPLIFFDQKTDDHVDAIIKKHELKNYLVFVPSAAYPLKRWPLNYWKELALKNRDKKIVVLAGPQDTFTQELDEFSNIINLTGQTSLIVSAGLINRAQIIVTNDTGMLHFSEQLGQKTIALMGPAPFGFPSRSSTVILEKNLKCRPCSKHGQGPCINSSYQLCMTALTPELVQTQIERLWL